MRFSGAQPPALAALLMLAACSDHGAAERARLDRIEQRLDALEKRVAQTGAPATTSRTAAPPTLSAAPAPADARKLSLGAVAVFHPAPQHAEQLGETPADSVGGFVYTGGAIALDDAASRGARYAGLTGVELQCWLRAKEAGRYQLGADIRTRLGLNQFLSPDCILQTAIEDRQVGVQRVRPSRDGTSGDLLASPVVGADLQPGLYKLRLWTACTPTPGQKTSVTLLIKPPSELNLRGVTADDMLHKAQ